MRGDQAKSGGTKNIRKKVMISIAVILGILTILSISVYGLFKYYAGLVDYQPIVSENEILTDLEEDDLVLGEDSPRKVIDEVEADLIDNLEAGATDITNHENVFNILLIGTDERSGQSRGRSDTMIIISINEETKEIVLTSLLRDIYINIPEVGNNRLNAAYAYGGASLLMDTIETNLGISIDRYVQVGFETFVDVIDSIDGVTIDLSEAEIYYMNKELEGDNPLIGSGNTYRLDGAQALQYSRIRFLDSDFVRTERQRNVIEALFKQAEQLSLLEINKLLNEILPKVTTDLTEGELFSLVLSSPEYLGFDVVTFRLPLDDTWEDLTINGMMVLGIDFEENRNALIEQIYKQTDTVDE